MAKVCLILSGVAFLVLQTALLDELSADEGPIKTAVSISGGGFRSAAFAYGVLSELDRMKICKMKADAGEDEHWIVVQGHEEDRCAPMPQPHDLLDTVGVVSGVSGGAMPAAFWHEYGREYFMRQFEKDALSDVNDMKKMLQDSFEDAVLPPLGVALVDIVPLVPGSLLSGMYLSDRLEDQVGIVKHERVAEFFRTKVLKANGLKKPVNSPELLIHTTDLTNSSIFTFFARDPKCLRGDGKAIPLSKVLAATAAIPGLVEPLRVFPVSSSGASLDCLRRYGNAMRNATSDSPISLTDGGVYDNLAIDGLLRYLVYCKQVDSCSAEQGQSFITDSIKPALSRPDQHDPQKTLILAINATPPAGFATMDVQQDLPKIVRHILRAFDLLTGQKDATSRFLAEETQRYGINILELSFKDLIDVKDDRATQMLRSLGRISWFPNPHEVQTLIAAGRLVASKNAGQIAAALNALALKHYAGDCKDLSDETVEYCWPERWNTINPFDEGLDRVLQEVRHDRDDLRQRQFQVLQEGKRGAAATLANAINLASCGTNVYAVDYGLIDWQDPNSFERYQKANIDAIRRGVSVSRIFIITEQLRRDHQRLARLVRAVLEQVKNGSKTEADLRGGKCEGHLTVHIALKDRLMENDKTMMKYTIKHGMALFEYNPQHRVLVEEAIEYAGEKGHSGLYYALKTRFQFEAINMATEVTERYDREADVKEGEHFSKWINVDAPREAPEIVCRLKDTVSASQLLSDLSQRRTPCAGSVVR